MLLLQFRIFTAPFHYVGFADFWLADQLNSLATVLLDLEYLVCFYSVEVEWTGYTGYYLRELSFFVLFISSKIINVIYTAPRCKFLNCWIS